MSLGVLDGEIWVFLFRPEYILGDFECLDRVNGEGVIVWRWEFNRGW